MKNSLAIAAGLFFLVSAGTRAAQAQMGSFGGPPINYMTAEVNDPVAKLSAKL